MIENNQNNSSINNKDEIDLLEIFNKIWEERKLILRITAIFFVLGLIIAIGTPKEYKAETTLLIETGTGSSMNGLLQQFGGLAGLSLGANQNGENLNPEIYPQIVQSTPFLVEILGEQIHSSKFDSSTTVYQYLSTQIKPSVTGYVLGYTIGLPVKIIGLFKNKEKEDYTLPDVLQSPLKLTLKQEDMMNVLKGRIKLTPDDANGTLKISAEMPDPVASAELTDKVYMYLSKYLVEYKIQKVKNDLEFITKQHNEAKQRYIEAQQKLANYRDANRNVMLASSRTEEERLQNEYALTFNIFNGLSQQMEQAKLKVQEKTPILKVVDPVKVPLNKSKPKRGIIIIAMIFIGGFFGSGFILGKTMLNNKSL